VEIEPAGTCGFFVNKPGITSPCSQVDPLAWKGRILGLSQNARSKKVPCERERGVRRMQDNPTLNREHIYRIRSVARLRSVRSGEVLYEPSCPDVPLFVVLDGTVSISRTGEDDKILAVREPGQFTGEMSVISGSRSLLTARVTKDGAVLELTREKVLSLMSKDTELGDILTRVEASSIGSTSDFSGSRRCAIYKHSEHV
jgi:CRP-like cAMP-binding protein